jgi:tetratricopeptide (TPR) repeat protein
MPNTSPESPTPRVILDRENPWPGLATFDEESHSFFYGRSSELTQLVALVQRTTVTLLYGRSGLGKSSLINAGLFFELRKEPREYFPIPLTLRFSTVQPQETSALDYLVQRVKDDVGATLAAAKIDARPPAPNETLYEYFHREDIDFWDERNRPLTAVLVFDQFEELFTLGASDDLARKRTEYFLQEFAALAEGVHTAPVRRRFQENPGAKAACDFDKRSFKIVLCIREDYLPHLADREELFPSVLRQSMRLEEFSRDQALKVVEKPGGHLMAPGVAEQIVNFVSSSWSSETANGDHTRRLAKQGVDPSILSLLCQQLNEQRKARQRQSGRPELIEAAQLAGGGAERIIEQYYRESVADLPALRTFIEQGLVTREGHRCALPEQDALATEGVHPKDVDFLVRSRRILLREVEDGMRWLRLSHDRIAAVARQSRGERQQRLEKERLEHQAEQERRAKEKAEALALKLRWLAWMMALAALAAAAAAIFGFWQKAQAEKNESKLASSKAGQSELLYIIERDVADEARRLGQSTLIVDINKKVREYFQAHQPDDADESALRMEALVLEQYGDFQLAQGQFRQAHDSFQQSLAIRNRVLLLTNKIHDMSWRRDREQDRAISIDRLGNALMAQDHIADALERYCEALNIRKELVKSNSGVNDPANVQLQVDLSYSYENLGDAFVRKRQYTEAKANFKESMDMRRDLADKGLGSPPQQQSIKLALCSALDKLGNVLAAEAKYSDAIETYQKSREIRESLVSGEGQNLELQSQLAYSYQHIGEILELQQKFPEALKNFELYVKILQLLVDRDPEDTQRKYNQALGLEKYLVIAYLGKDKKALDSFDKSIEILQPLVRKYPEDLRFQQSLSLLFERRGDIFKDSYNLQEAEKSYRASCDLRKRLTELQSDNPRWQGDLASSFDRFGEIFEIQREFDKALSSYRESLNIRQRFDNLYPNDRTWQGYLAFSFEHIGDVAYGKGGRTEALGWYRKAFEIRRIL